MTISGLGQQLNINRIDVVGTPKTKTAFNQFDEHGLVVGLPRLKGESNWAYKRRILDVFVNRSNSTYRGLVNGITREFGLSLYDSIVINPKTDSNGKFLASDPYIKFDGVWLYLYSNYAERELNHKIDRYEGGGNYEHLYRLIDFINQTAYFEAYILPGIDRFTKSMTILNQSNRNEVFHETLSVSTKFQLKNEYIVSGSLYFSNRETFKTEVFSESEVSGYGKYYVDYQKGIVRSYTIPLPEDSVRYQYNIYPFRAKSSPVILHDLSNDNFKVKMFEQILLETGEYTHGVPTAFGADLINELLSVYPMYYGV